MNSSKSMKILILVVSMAFLGVGCTEVSRGLGSLTSNKYAKPRSGSIWVVPPPQLEPVAFEKKSVYISFRNISDADIDFTTVLKESATEQGWVLTSDPSKATYRLRASLRFWGEVQPDSGGAGKARFLGGITGAAVGLGAAAALSNSGSGNLGAAAGGLAVGGLVAAGLSNSSRPREWALISDFVLEEYSSKAVEFKLSRGTASNTTSAAGSSSGSSTIGGGTTEGNSSSGSITKESNYFPHGIRLSVWSNQMNMSEEEALPHINKRLQKVVKQMLPQ